MVSSKCCQVESPSPFSFLAALMPPCAHTECERLTGTMEKRSTVPPISAIFITAERPARPPPTTIILGAVIVLLFEFLMLRRESKALPHHDGVCWTNDSICGLQGPIEERAHRDHAHDHEQCSNREADIGEAPARLVARRNAQLSGKEPQSVSEVPRRTNNAYHIKRNRPRMLKFALHFAKSRMGMRQQVDAAETQMPGMPDHVGECDGSGPTLRGVHPVAGPGIIG